MLNIHRRVLKQSLHFSNRKSDFLKPLYDGGSLCHLHSSAALSTSHSTDGEGGKSSSGNAKYWCVSLFAVGGVAAYESKKKATLTAHCEQPRRVLLETLNKNRDQNRFVYHGWKGKTPPDSGLRYPVVNELILPNGFQGGEDTSAAGPKTTSAAPKAAPRPAASAADKKAAAPVAAAATPVVAKQQFAATPGAGKATSSAGDHFPEYVPYVIVGGGPAGIAAALAIRASDPTSQVLLISAEPHVPYLRPALSKEVWRRSSKRQQALLNAEGDMSQHSWLFFEPESFFVPPEKLEACTFGGVGLLKNTKVAKIDTQRRLLELNNGTKVHYGQCCISTGGRPKLLHELHHCSKTQTDLYAAGRISYFRSLDDYKKLRELADKLDKSKGKIVVIGGGFLGSELATSLSEIKSPNSQLQVVHVFQEEAPMSRVLPPYLAEHTRKYLQKKSVQVKANTQAVGIALQAGGGARDSPLQLTLKSSTSQGDAGTEDDISHIVVVVGIEPNTDLANSAPELEVDHKLGGFLVNTEMEAVKGVYVAGDVSSFYDPLLGRRRVEHQNHAEESGRIAGRNMAASLAMERAFESTIAPPGSQPAPETPSDLTVLSRATYQYQSSMWSYLGPELMWDAVGLCDPHKLDTHGFFSTAELESDGTEDVDAAFKQYDRPGVVFYMETSTGRIKGILLWNLPDELYRDEDKYAPSRLNLARKILADAQSFRVDDLAALAKNFDLDGSFDLVYQRMMKNAKDNANAN